MFLKQNLKSRKLYVNIHNSVHCMCRQTQNHLSTNASHQRNTKKCRQAEHSGGIFHVPIFHCDVIVLDEIFGTLHAATNQSVIPEIAEQCNYAR